jgi:hypothetical protein
MSIIGYQIFDSLDNSVGYPADCAHHLWGAVDNLNDEAEEEGTGITYAIGALLSDGSVTFDFS